MKKGDKIVCDACERVEDRNSLTRDGRPFVGSLDRFFDFTVPPKKEDLNMLTGRVMPGKFRGIASSGNDKQLAALHACPGCAQRIRAAFANKAPEMLPAGPLRALMTMVKTKYGGNAMGVS